MSLLPGVTCVLLPDFLREAGYDADRDVIGKALILCRENGIEAEIVDGVFRITDDIDWVADRLGLREGGAFAGPAQATNAQSHPEPVGRPVDPDCQGEMETVSYHLPVELIELYRDLAEERLRLERAEKRRARRAGEKPPQARRSASAIVREAMEAYRAKVEAEMCALRPQTHEEADA